MVERLQTEENTRPMHSVVRPLNAKRHRRGAGGIEGWYSYYAGYTEQFATDVIRAAELQAGSVVLDPWNGSGTTTSVADRLGYEAIGFDLNPVAAIVGSAKLARVADATHVSGLAAQFARVATDARTQAAAGGGKTDPLDRWIGTAARRAYRVIAAQIVNNLATDSGGLTLAPLSSGLPPLASFLMLALMRSARKLAGVAYATNPTWIRPRRTARSTAHQLTREWEAIIAQMALDLKRSGATGPVSSRVSIGDARALEVASNSVDLVLTSPPYCTRIDYPKSTAFELAALGMGEKGEGFDGLRRTLMGTPLVRSGPAPAVKENWPERVSALLDAIRAHPSKASHSYYYKTYWQYFHDCELSLSEIARSLKPRGRAVLVVQTSYYKQLLVDLPTLYLDLADMAGLRGTVMSETQLRRSLVQINSRAHQRTIMPVHREAVLILEKA